ncbi:MAG TPA: MFS transporter [Archangium sp.]|uniref:MFS transporter n=1 Tax=Archangium sp. TaxID=1872627 RepID=UPI002ED8C651
MSTEAQALPLAAYQKRLFVFLSVATFFEGFDFFAITNVLPNVQAEMGFSLASMGLLIAFINIGSILAYALVSNADRFGRRTVLNVTIVGYTIFTFLTGFSPDVYVFALCQMVARIFLTAEFVVSQLFAAEEFPAERRGMVMGVVSASSSLGAIFCAAVVPLILKSPYGWRTLYLAGILPLVIVMYARRNLQETRRFEQVDATERKSSLLAIWKTGYRNRLLWLGLIWMLVFVGHGTALVFWKKFAVSERGLSDAQVGSSLALASLVALPLTFAAGKIIDQLGRRLSAVLIFGSLSVGVFFAYTLQGQWPLTVALIFLVFGLSAVWPVLNAFTSELFPTHLRGHAFAWVSNVIGRTGGLLFTPMAVGAAAQSLGLGRAVSLTALAPLLAAGLVWWLLPETRNKELEATSSL